jgi:hypothetical protein
MGVYLMGVHLTGVYLMGVYLTGVHLSAGSYAYFFVAVATPQPLY